MNDFRRWMTLCEHEESEEFSFWLFLAEARRISAYEPEIEPLRLNQFLRNDFTIGREGDINSKRMAGGLKDPGGDVRAIVGGIKGRPGLVNNATGQNLDDATMRAWTAGYFPEFDQRPMINDLLDKISEDHNGQPVYSHQDQDAINTHQYAQKHNSEVSRMASETGISPEGVTAQQFWDAVSAHMGEQEDDPHQIEPAHTADQDQDHDHDWFAPA
jgi:hypothetical protein